MIPPRIQKLRFTSILITILIALFTTQYKLAAAEIIRSSRTTDTGTNHTAVITGINLGRVTEDDDPDANNLLEVSRKLNITDSDAGEAAFIAGIIKGSYGRLRINSDGNWTYVAINSQAVIQNLASGATLTDSLVVNSVDGTAVAYTFTGLPAGTYYFVVTTIDTDGRESHHSSVVT